MYRRFFLAIFLGFFFISPCLALTAEPVLYFSDLTDGPISGWNGSKNQGAAVSIWGNNFGSFRGSSYVTVGGVRLTSNSDYAEWGATKNPRTANGQQRITFWLNSSMSLGNTTITVTTDEGTSQALPFYTRNTGHIYFVSPTGKDKNTGLNDSNQMWASFPKARDVADAGDIVYFRTGTWNATDPDSVSKWPAVLAMVYGNFNNGTEHNSITFAGYPAEAPQIGDGTGSIWEVFMFRADHKTDPGTRYWTFSKLTVNRYDKSFFWEANPKLHDLNFRIVGNDMTSTEDAPTHGHLINTHGNFTDFKVLGNYLHGAGKVNDTAPPTTKTKAIYFAGEGEANGVDIGWNEMAYCNGHTQFFGHQRADSIRNLSFHDNFIHDQGQQSLVLCGGDPTADPQYKFCRGPIAVYNNIISNTVGDSGENGVIKFSAEPNGNGGNIEVYNNTFYHTGAITTFVSDSFNYHDNIVIRRDNAWRNYWYQGAAGYGHEERATNNEVGNHNVWFNSKKSSPAWSTNDVTITSADQFVSATPVSYQDFKIRENSSLYGKNIGAQIYSVTSGDESVPLKPVQEFQILLP